MALALAVVSAAAVCLAILLPYVRAEQAHELYRVFEPTAAVRAGASTAPLDLFGSYLNNFAWTYDGTITAWAVGIPVLVGLACARGATFRRQAPLVACGALALVLEMTPKIGFVGRAMVSLRPLFASRFPAAEYKAVVAVALIVLAADAWSQIASRRRGLRWRAVLAGGVLVFGALLAPSTYGSPTRELWLVVAVVAISCALVAIRLPRRLLAGLLIGLVIVDGVREAYDYRLQGTVSSWRATPAEAAPYRARDAYVRKLPALLEQAPNARPARVPPFASLANSPTGTDLDATGWIADGYHLIDYGGTIERVLWRAEHNPTWEALLLAPSRAYTFPCASTGCRTGMVHLPTANQWKPSSDVHTLAYGSQSIVYSVDISRPELMIENELSIRGWHSDTPRVRPVDAGVPLRAWRLSSGDYRFIASFQEPDRTPQELAAMVSLIAWIGCCFLIGRRRRVPA